MNEGGNEEIVSIVFYPSPISLRFRPTNHRSGRFDGCSTDGGLADRQPVLSELARWMGACLLKCRSSTFTSSESEPTGGPLQRCTTIGPHPRATSSQRPTSAVPNVNIGDVIRVGPMRALRLSDGDRAANPRGSRREIYRQDGEVPGMQERRSYAPIATSELQVR